MQRFVRALAGLFFLAGCAGGPVVGPGQAWIDGVYRVDPQIRWSRFSQRNVEIWTVDGLPLQAIYFIHGIKKDAPLLGSPAPEAQKSRPRFSPEMTPNEIMEFVVDSLARAGYAQLQAHNLRPERFGRASGFRFELTFLFRDGLEGQGLVVGAVIAERLQLIVYLGTREYYYPKHIGDVEKIVQSIELK